MRLIIKKRPLLIVSFLVATCIAPKCFSQQNYSFEITDSHTNTDYQMENRNVSSDHGRREGNLSKFHNGVDFNILNFLANGTWDGLPFIETGFTIKSINAGSIAKMYLGEGIYKIITVEGDDGVNFGYGHVFSDDLSNVDESGEFLKYRDTPHLEWVIIYHPRQADSYILTADSDADLAMPGYSIDYTYDPNPAIPNDDITVTYTVAGPNNRILNDVTQGGPLAPVGGSGGFANAPHVHLYKLRDADPTSHLNVVGGLQHPSNTMDPLYDLSQVDFDRPTYELSIVTDQTHSHTMDNSTTILNGARVRVDWNNSADVVSNRDNQNYSGAVLDINGVELFIKKSTDPVSKYSMIEGSQYFSKIYEGCVDGQGDASTIYPDFVTSRKDDHNGSTDAPFVSAGFGAINKIGIVGISYRESNIPDYINDEYPNGVFPTGQNRQNNGAIEDYFFNDFPSRRKGSDRTELAKEIFEAKYPDGEYHLIAQAIDIYGDRHPTTRSGAPTSLIIDNFKPYVKEVIVRKSDPLLPNDNTILYRGIWEWDENATPPILFLTTNRINFDEGSPFIVVAKVSEPVRWSAPLATPELSLRIDPLGTFYPSEFSADRMEFTFTLPALPSPQQNQPQKLYFDGYDLNNNRLEQDPQSIALRTGPTTWTAGADPGENSSFEMNSADAYCSSGNGSIVDNGNSKTPLAMARVANTTAMVTGCNYVDIDVSKQNPQVGEAVIFKAITGPYSNLEWDFGGGSFPPFYDSKYNEEVTVVFAEEIDHTITLTIDGEQVTKLISVGAKEPSFNFVLGKSTSNTIQINDNVDFYVDYFLGVDQSEIISYYWEFGNGAEYTTSNTATVNNVTYNSPGPKTVSLTACTALSCQTVSENRFVYVTGYPFPIRSWFTCPTSANVSGSPQSGMVIFSGNFNGGDDIANNETYFWNFGDGGTSTLKNDKHYYKDPGNYTITFTVCDLSGCFTYPNDDPNAGPCTLNVPENKFPPIVNPNFTINGELAKVNGVEQPAYIAKGMTFILDDASTLLAGDEPSFFDISYRAFKNGTPVWWSDDGKGPHIVDFNGEEPGDSYLLEYNYDGNFVYTTLHIDCSTGIEKCETNIKSLSLSSYCWDDMNPIQITVDATSSCSGLVYRISHAGSNGFISESSLTQVNFPLSSKPPYFPFTIPFKVGVYYCDLLTGLDGLMDEKVIDVTIFGPDENIDVTNTYNLCTGASTSIGVQASSGFSYEWSGGNPQFLSSKTSANPVFTGLADGSYDYTLHVTNLQSGCTFEQGTVSIVVGTGTNSIGAANYTRDININSGPVTLQAPFDGDGRSYDYEWTPATYLNNPRVPNPVFTPPTSGLMVPYSVTASFRQCTTTGSATINAINYPPEGLSVSNEIAGVLQLSWTDKSVESKFVIERSEDGGGWETIDEVGSNVTSYTDAFCLNPDIEYCYRVKGIGLNGSAITHIGNSYSNSDCDRIEYELFEKWEVEYQGIRTRDFPSQRIGNFHEYDQDHLILVTVEDETTHTGSDDTNLATFLVDKETGIVSSHTSNNLSTSWDEYSSSVKNNNETSGGFVILSGGQGVYYNDGNSWDRRYIGTFLGDDPVIVSDGTYGYYIFGATNQKNADDEYYLCSSSGSKKRETLTNVLAQVLVNDFQLVSPEVRFITPQFDNYEHWFEAAIPMANGNILIAADFKCYQMPGSPNNTNCNGCPLPNGLELLIKTPLLLEPIRANKIEYGTLTSQIGDHQLIVADNNNFILAGTAYDGSQNSQTNQRIWFSKFDDGLNRLWEKDLKWNTQKTYLDEIIRRKSGEYIIVGHTNTSTDNMHVYNIDESGNTIWESHFTYVDASRIFDVHMIDKDNLIIGGKSVFVNGDGVESDHRSISIKKLSLNPDLTLPISICENVNDDESLSKVGMDIHISENCSVTFEAGSSTNLVATSSITMHDGTWIKEGAYFSAEATESITVGDCSDFGLSGSRVHADLDEEFETSEFEHNIYQVYPNPSTDQFQIALTFTEAQDVKLYLFDINGRKVWEDAYQGEYYYNEVKTKKMSSGLYLLRIVGTNGTDKTMRILISK